MLKKFSFWIWGAIITQLFTAALHSLSLFVTPEPANETEKQLMDLTRNYRQDAGMGFHPSFKDFFTGFSISFMLLFLFGGLINLYFKRKNLLPELWKGLLLIETVIFGAVFIAMTIFTFILPVICTGLIFLFVLGAFLSVKIK